MALFIHMTAFSFQESSIFLKNILLLALHEMSEFE